MTKERVTNEQAVYWANDMITTLGHKEVQDLSADLLDARNERDEAVAMIREMRNGYDIIMTNTQNPAHTMTKLGLENTQEANRSIAISILEKSKRYAE
jgi:dipeptidase